MTIPAYPDLSRLIPRPIQDSFDMHGMLSDGEFDDELAAVLGPLVGAYPVDGPVFAGTGEAQFANALASGHKSLFLPEGLALIVTSAKTVPAGVKLELRKGARITASGVNINALLVNDDSEVSGEGSIVCCGSSGSYSAFNGAAIAAPASKARVKIRGITISNHRGWGIVGVDPVGWEIEKVRATAANNPGSPDHTQMFADIGLIGGATRCTIRDCDLDSGQAFPILVQTQLNTAASVLFNIIENNYINGALGHGISLYGQNLQNTSAGQVQGTGQDTYYGNIIKANRVNGTLGSLILGGGSTHPYGCGIYVQGGTGTIVANNQVNGAALNTDVEVLAPAGIGITNCRSWLCESNIVRNSTWYGIYYTNANDGGTIGQVGLSRGNLATACAKSCFKVISACDVSLVGDTATLGSSFGFEFRDANANAGYRVKSCLAFKNASDGFVTVGATIAKLMIDDCDSMNNSGNGFGFQNSTVTRLYLKNCRAQLNTGTGIRGYSIGTGITITEWDGNYAIGNTTDYLLGSALPSVGLHHGTGSPEGVVLANKGCRFIRGDGAALTCMYVFEGANGGSAGWAGK
jgi:hypothetical protein